jgi:starvation-inducible DNA-binding protein
MKPDLGLSDKSRAAVCKFLSVLLADEFVLYTKTRDAHWHVTGPHFSHLHAFFESQYGQLEETIDEVAERIRMLGGRAPASLTEYLKLTRLKEHPGKEHTAQGYTETLLLDHEAVIRALRKDLEAAAKSGDAGTNDFLTGLLEAHEKMAWMLRASVKE